MLSKENSTNFVKLPYGIYFAKMFILRDCLTRFNWPESIIDGKCAAHIGMGGVKIKKEPRQ